MVNHADLERFDGIEMDIALGEGDDEAGFAEKAIDLKSQVTFDFAEVHFAFDLGPEIDVEDEGIVAEVIEEKDGFGCSEDAFVRVDGLSDELGDNIGGRAVDDADGEFGANVFIIM